MIVRMPVDSISRIGRNTQGVRVVNLKPGDRLKAAARVVESDDQEDEPSVRVARPSAAGAAVRTQRVVRVFRPESPCGKACYPYSVVSLMRSRPEPRTCPCKSGPKPRSSPR